MFNTSEQFTLDKVFFLDKFLRSNNLAETAQDGSPADSIKEEAQGSGNGPKEEGFFQRIEDKFLFSKNSRDRVLNKISSVMNPSYPVEGTEFTLIESIYFDGQDFKFFQDHFQRLEARYKLRLRKYAPNGIWNKEVVLIELKEKVAGVCKKIRFRLNKKNYKRVKKGKVIKLTSDLIKLNSDISLKTLRSRVKKINHMIETLELRPRLKVRYTRLAFAKDDFRLTIDNNLEYKLIDNIEEAEAQEISEKEVWQKAVRQNLRYEDQETSIMEMKHGGEIPSWAKRMLSDFGINKTSFSKYCWSVGTAIQQNI